MRPAAWLAVVAWLALAAPGSAPAQGVGDGAVARPGHAWVVVADDPGARVVHLPPRSLVERPSEAGSVKSARELAEMPTGCAAVGSRVYLTFRDGLTHKVLSGRAVASVGGLWAFEPVERLEAHPTLPEGTLAGFVGTDPGPTALLRRGDDFRALRLGRDGWEDLALPANLPPVALVRWEGQPAVVTRPGELWVLRGDAWARASVPAMDVREGDRAFGIGAQVVSLRGVEGGVWVRAFDAAGTHELGRVDGVPVGAAAAPVVLDAGRLVLLWQGGEGEPFRVVEMSVGTGEAFYAGPLKPIMPVSEGDFRILAMALVVVTAAVLLIAIRPMGSREVVLPASTALAEPSRRLAATFVDVLIAMFIASQVFGVRVLDIMTLRVVFEPVGWLAIPAVLGIGWAMGTAMEAAFGRTVGKFLLGCRAVRSDGSGAGPGAWRSAVRNLVKWGLPPIPALALFEPEGPHRGDLLAGVVVVLDVEAEPEAPAEP